MREIKFRVRNTAANSWMDSSSVLSGVSNANHFVRQRGDDRTVFLQSESATHPNVIMQQFTGLKDVNGKEIYEGDICRCAYNMEKIGVVEFQKGSFDLINPYTGDYLGYEEEFLIGDCMVIGNNFDNPELIKRV